MTDDLTDMVAWLDVETDPAEYGHKELVMALSETAMVLGAAQTFENLDADVTPATPGLVGRLRGAVRRVLFGRPATVHARPAALDALTPEDVPEWRACIEARYKLLAAELRERPSPDRPTPDGRA